MTQQAKRVTIFDAWAAQYDTAVATAGDDFPFAGYDEVLTTAVRTAGARPSLRVLELSIGTGNLAERFYRCRLPGLGAGLLRGYAGSGAGQAAPGSPGPGRPAGGVAAGCPPVV